ncbi:hypothetical protein [Natronobacterium gregoryi]|uniref:Beta-ketoadipyl CoA thiolase n=2 Tax=Natronobacterium gregoryi TaxID=44930 RepID=L0AFQ2_NATGS|nr:hypothetical protein [Natronobacterium gregoryi]AFZ71982.1 hypothetical protein Natgr_0740 [Natronobacterium gregoryi SP2]ELY62654.1 beta-ketoadipyl CoA thiolase [Natronobacterium gregoryi SP2]PLK20837.1 hypothetical protein CYV19_07085 [Natronobacterium gregoryi SP2]SFJ19447.1 hypothetical protein SAMN05443661_11720 [Natronobacterium gregoryi]
MTSGLVAQTVSTELIVLGVVVVAVAAGLLGAGRRFYPRLDLDENELASIRLLTALLGAILLLIGLGLVVVGFLT